MPPESSPGSQLKSSITEASRKIESIIDDAERAAADIRAEAREEAELESRRAISEKAAELSSVVEPLVQRVENLRVEAAALVHQLESATHKLVELSNRTVESAPSLDSETPEAEAPELIEELPRPEPEPSTAPGPVPVAYAGTAGPQRASSDSPEEAVLRATQMAVAGSSRSEIEDTLRVEFGMADAGALVNDILGPA